MPHPHPTVRSAPPPADDTVLRITQLVKHYRGRPTPANDDISLTARSGRVLGVLGHNGAGKTTLVNQIVGLLRPNSGSISVAGVDAVAHPDRARELVSIQAQANVPITGLTPKKAIELVGRIRGGKPEAVRRRTAELIEALDLGPWADTPAQKISGGVARLTAFCMTVVQPGKLVILDEPTNDVDPARRRLLWDAIRETASAGSAVLLVTHNVREAEHTVDELVVLDTGRVIAAGTPAQLTAHLLAASSSSSSTASRSRAPGRASPEQRTRRPAHRASACRARGRGCRLGTGGGLTRRGRALLAHPRLARGRLPRTCRLRVGGCSMSAVTVAGHTARRENPARPGPAARAADRAARHPPGCSSGRCAGRRSSCH